MYLVECEGEQFRTVTSYYHYEDVNIAREEAKQWSLENKRKATIYKEIERISVEETVTTETIP